MFFLVRSPLLYVIYAIKAVVRLDFTDSFNIYQKVGDIAVLINFLYLEWNCHEMDK